MKYDYLIVGSGLFGATFAYFAKKAGKKCLVIDKRPQLGGNVYCEEVEGINVHKYGAHIFHTSNKEVWNFVNSIVEFNRYTNCPVANYKGKLYNLPFNMNTFCQMWGVTTPEEAKAKIDEQKSEAVAALNGREPQNLEEQALCLVGRDIFYTLIKEYTEKQWGRKCTELPAFIIKRLPVRMVFDNNYFNDKYQGIPVGGYNKLIDGLLEGIDWFIHSADYKNTLNLKVLGKFIRYGKGNVNLEGEQRKSAVPMQLTAVWGMQDLFGVTGLRFSGFADFWWENHTVCPVNKDGERKWDEGKTSNVVFITEPQLWYAVGQHFGVDNLNVGTEIELSYDFGSAKGFWCRLLSMLLLVFLSLFLLGILILHLHF